jgi:transaldolase
MADEKDNINSPKLWLSVSQSAKLCGVEQKTIRRAIKAKVIIYAVQGDRYTIEVGSLIAWAHQSAKIKNKLNKDGIGKFVKSWKEEYAKLSTEKTSQ